MSDKFLPLTEVEYNELVDKLKEVTNYLPENLMSYVWNLYKRIENTNEPQPCGCASAGGHWKKAVEVLRNYINQVQSK